MGKFRLTLTVDEFIDTGERIEVQGIGNYQEFCWGWEDAKKTIRFFMKRIEKKLNGGSTVG